MRAPKSVSHLVDPYCQTTFLLFGNYVLVECRTTRQHRNCPSIDHKVHRNSQRHHPSDEDMESLQDTGFLF